MKEEVGRMTSRAGNGEPACAGSTTDRRRWDRAVKIYLLSIDNRRFFFYADESEAAREQADGSGSSGPTPSGLRGWVLDRFHQLKSVLEHSESSVARWTRQSWDWLHSWSHPDESML